MSDFDAILNEADDIEEPSAPETPATTEPASEPEAAAETPTVEAVAETPVEATPDAPAVQLPDGYKLDALGRVHGPDGRVVSKEEAEKIKAQAIPAEPVAPVTPDVPAVTPEPAKPEPAQPFKYRARGETHELKDIRIDGAPESIGVIRQALNAYHMVPALQSENAQLKQQMQSRGESEHKSETLVKSLTAILETQDEAAALEQFFRLRQDWPVLMAKAEAMHWRQRAEMGLPPQQEPPSQDATGGLPPEDVVLEASKGYIEDLKFVPEFAKLTDGDWQQYAELVTANPYLYVRPATAQHAQQHPGVKVGQPVFDTDVAMKHVRTFAAQVSKAREAEANAVKAREAARFNTAQQPVKPATTTPPRVLAKQPAMAGAPAKTKSWDQQVSDAFKDTDDDE